MTLRELVYENYNFVVDSRLIKENDVFLAYKGEKVDGHDYVEEAFKKGASYCVVEKNLNYNNPNIIIVGSVEKELLTLSSELVNKANLKIGITGSTGKTTTKEILYEMLKPSLKVFKTEKNYNTEIGIPLTILNNYNGEEVVILEMGLQKENDLKYLTEFYRIDVAFITNIGHSHIEFLKTLENVAVEKMKITANMEKGLLICFGDNDYLNSLIPKHLNFLNFGKNKNNSGFLIDYEYVNEKTKVLFEIHKKQVLLTLNNFWSEGQLLDLLACLIFIIYIEFPIDPFILEQIKLPENRFQIFKSENGIIISDCYNASLESFKSGFDSIKKISDYKKILIMGEIKELGELSQEIHNQIVDLAKNIFDKIFFYDPNKKFMYEDVIFFDKIENIAEIINEHKSYLIYLKASNSIGFEKFIKERGIL